MLNHLSERDQLLVEPNARGTSLGARLVERVRPLTRDRGYRKLLLLPTASSAPHGASTKSRASNQQGNNNTTASAKTSSVRTGS